MKPRTMKPRTMKPRTYQLYIDGKLQPRRRFALFNKALPAAMYAAWLQPNGVVTQLINMQSGRVVFEARATANGIVVP